MTCTSINTVKKQKQLWSVALVVLVTLLFPAPQGSAQQMQKGISVELASTRNAAAMPDANNVDALIVAVTEHGNVYLGIDPVTPAALAEEIKTRLSERQLYIKADARTPYANVEKVLATVRAAGVESPSLLTAQPESPKPGTIVPPKGLEVLLSWPSAGTASTSVQLFDSGQQGPTLTINHEQVPWDGLQDALSHAFQNRSEKAVAVKADGRLPFANVVHVIDVCRSIGASVVLVTTGS
jgi:biopolymer transport protein ExbD